MTSVNKSVQESTAPIAAWAGLPWEGELPPPVSDIGDLNI